MTDLLQYRQLMRFKIIKQRFACIVFLAMWVNFLSLAAFLPSLHDLICQHSHHENVSNDDSHSSDANAHPDEYCAVKLFTHGFSFQINAVKILLDLPEALIRFQNPWLKVHSIFKSSVQARAPPVL